MTKFLSRLGKPDLAYCSIPESSTNQNKPHIVFMGGFRSDMGGTKAMFLEEVCRSQGLGYTRFDYSAHGQSEGTFEDQTIGTWLQDGLDILDHVLVNKSAILIGSSMGGWIGLLCALKKPGQIKGFIGIAAAPDFTKDIYENRMSDAQRMSLRTHGHVAVDNDYGDPYIITNTLIEEAKAHLLLEQGIPIKIPVRLIQGMKDTDVNWQHAFRIKNAIPDGDVEVLLIEEGDHRLSRPSDLQKLENTLLSLVSG